MNGQLAAVAHTVDSPPADAIPLLDVLYADVLPARDETDCDNELRYIASYFHRGEALAELEARLGAVARDAFGMTEIGFGTYNAP